MSMLLPNSCFIHIPRTGGMWAERIIDRLGLLRKHTVGDEEHHAPLADLPNAAWRGRVPFTIIRHPFRWVASRWSHSLKIGAYEEHRFHGVHRKFDECVVGTLEGTVRKILTTYPELVSETFRTMVSGIPVENLLCTAQLEDGLYRILNRLEGTTKRQYRRVMVDPLNQSSGLAQYQERAYLSFKTCADFIDSEMEAYTLWRKVYFSVGRPLPL